MEDKLTGWQKLIAAVVAGLVIGGSIWLTELNGWQTIKHWWSHPTLVVTSVQRPNAKDVLSGEKLNIHFDRGVSGRVVWLFDDKEPFLGWDQVQHAFVNDRAQAGIGQHHRIDAFFRPAGSYETVSLVIEVDPAPTFGAALRVAGARLQVTTSAKAGNYWQLDGVTLASYADGKFIETAPLTHSRLSLTVSADTTEHAATLLRWYADTGDLARSMKTGATWAVYDFHGKAGEPLKLMRPLGATVDGSLRRSPR